MATVEITGWRVGFNKVACTEIVRAASGLSLSDVKGITDGVLEGKPQRVAVPSNDIAQCLVRNLAEVGAVAIVVAN